MPNLSNLNETDPRGRRIRKRRAPSPPSCRPRTQTMGKNKPNKPPAPTAKSKGSPKIVYAGVAMLVGAAAVAWQLYGGGAPPKVPEPPKTNRRQTTTTESPKRQQAAAKQQRSKPPSPPPPRPMVSGKVDPNCVDSDESCESWARSGECDRNQGFMHSNCRASCHICNGGKPKPKRASTVDGKLGEEMGGRASRLWAIVRQKLWRLLNPAYAFSRIVRRALFTHRMVRVLRQMRDRQRRG